MLSFPTWAFCLHPISICSIIIVMVAFTHFLQWHCPMSSEATSKNMGEYGVRCEQCSSKCYCAIMWLPQCQQINRNMPPESTEDGWKNKTKITAKAYSFNEIWCISRQMWFEMQCYTVQLSSGFTQSDIITAVTGPEYESEIESTKDTPYLTLTGELRYVFCENFGWNWPCYNSTTLYMAWLCNGMPVR